MGLISLYLLAVIFALIDQCYCAVSWKLEEPVSKVITEYTQYRETNFHRGIFLSYSSKEKNEICQDYYFPQLLEAEYINSEETEGIEKLVFDGLDSDSSSELDENIVEESDELILAEAGPTPEERFGKVTRVNIGVPSEQESGITEEEAEETTRRPSQRETERARVPIRASAVTSSGVIDVPPTEPIGVSFSRYSEGPSIGGTTGRYPFSRPFGGASGGVSGGPPGRSTTTGPLAARISDLSFKSEAWQTEETSSLKSERAKPPHSVKVIELITEGQELPNFVLAFQCSIKDQEQRRRNPDNKLYFMVSAQRLNWLYIGLSDERNEKIKLDRNMWLSPTYNNIYFERKRVEKLYVNMRQNLDKLKSESAEYMEMIESRNDIYLLSNKQKLFTCLTLLASSVYRRIVPRTTISLKWLENRYQNTYSEKVKVILLNEENKSYEYDAEGIPCGSYNIDLEEYQTVYVTVSNDDRDSVFVLEQGKNKVSKEPYFYVSKYFKKVTSLMNPQVPLSDTELLQIFKSQGVKYEFYGK